MKRSIVLAVGSAVVASTALLAPAAQAAPAPATAPAAVPAPAFAPAMGLPGGKVWTGPAQTLGDGTVRNVSIVRGKTPVAIGVTFTGAALTGLPNHPPTDGTHCVDVDGDGVIDDHMECVGGYEQRLPWPKNGATAPYQFTMLNWNPMGHSGMLYHKPHFDVHFYVTSEADTDAIRMGTCAELVDCSLMGTALKPLPAQYQPAGYVAPEGAVEGQMGAHMVDPASPVGDGFTRTFIYGKYDGRITFLEPMITLEHLLAVKASAKGSAPGVVCDPVAQPQAWQQRGWYPKSACVRYSPTLDQFAVTLEDLAQG